MLAPSKGVRLAPTMAVFVLACFGAAADFSLARADYDAGKRAMEAGQPIEAAAHWRAAARSGDRRAMLALGRLFAREPSVVQSG